jgi:branched-chain amino acid transport system substrate-binding protein
VFAGARAAVKAINDAGGAGGHELKLITCDSQQNGTVSATCWRSLTSNPNVVVTTDADTSSRSL